MKKKKRWRMLFSHGEVNWGRAGREQGGTVMLFIKEALILEFWGWKNSEEYGPCNSTCLLRIEQGGHGENWGLSRVLFQSIFPFVGLPGSCKEGWSRLASPQGSIGFIVFGDKNEAELLKTTEYTTQRRARGSLCALWPGCYNSLSV